MRQLRLTRLRDNCVRSMTRIVVSQCFSISAIVVAVVSYFCSSLNKTTFYQFISNIFYCVSFIVLGEMSGFIQVSIATVRSLVFYLYGAKKPVYSIVIFEILSLACLGAFWEGYISILPCIAVVVFTYGLWQDRRGVFYLCAIIMSSLLIIYNTIICAYMNVLLESMLIVSACVYFVKKIIPKVKNCT